MSVRYRRLAALACCLTTTTSAHVYDHGSVVFTLAVRDGFVMAADGLTLSVGGEPGRAVVKRSAAAEPKIAVCGPRLLCGMVGVNPFPKELNIKYDFQGWILAIKSGHEFSPRLFTQAIDAKAQVTFRNFRSILMTDSFWKSKQAPQDLLDFQVAGFDGKTPQICNLRIAVNRQQHQLEYPKPECFTPRWESPSPTSVIPYPLSFGDSIAEALKGGTPEAKYLVEILPAATSAAHAILPEAPPSLQEVVGDAAAFVRMTDEFNPDQAGGITTIGVLQKGRKPIVFQFPDGDPQQPQVR